jgi:hypothetical protein
MIRLILISSSMTSKSTQIRLLLRACVHTLSALQHDVHLSTILSHDVLHNEEQLHPWAWGPAGLDLETAWHQSRGYNFGIIHS